MSGNIRKQLGPARKRLEDRIKETEVLLDGTDSTRINDARSRLGAILEYHEKLTNQLCELTDVSPEEITIIETEIERCTGLNMDAREIMFIIDERLAMKAETKKYSYESELKAMETEKLSREIEKLKLDSEYTRKQLEQLDQRNTNVNRKVKLPRLSLPSFNGNITEWPSFWDSFSSTIHFDNSLSQIDKFKYLMSSLEGEARTTLSGFNLTDAQYDQAVKLLQERYDDREYIIHSFYGELTNLPRCTNSTSELRKTLNFIETKLRSLESMGENVENKYMVAVIKAKLPEEFTLKLEESRDGDWTIMNLRKSMSRLLIARERSEGTVTITREYCDLDYTAEGLLGKETTISCCFCHMNHWADECQTFKTLDARKSRLRGRCFNCLSSNHIVKQCRSEKPCFYCKRKRHHHSSLCPVKFGVIMPRENERRERKDNYEEGLRADEPSKSDVDPDVIMKTAKVMVQNIGNGKRELATVLLDTGAKRTYITSQLANILGLQCGSENTVKLNTFGTRNSSDLTTRKTRFCMIQRDGSSKIMNAKIVPEITGPMIKQKVNVEKYKRIWKNLAMADDLPDRKGTVHLDILIGNDYYDEIVKSDKIEIDDGLYLINSSLGWMFTGRIERSYDDNIEYSMFIGENESEIQHKFWDLETIGIKYVSNEVENSEIHKGFSNTIKQIGNRYQVSWPWKLSKFELPTNYALAEARLKSLVNSLEKDRSLLLRYDEIIKQQVDGGLIEEADSSQQYMQKDDVLTHYLPHHLIASDNNGAKKLRVVYEGCAKTHNSKRSLNECLHQGENMVANLCGILIRFRMNRIAFIADIEKAYLQLSLNPDDRDVTRFLWLRDINQPVDSGNIKEYRFCRVIWGIVCSAYLLASTINYHLSKYDSPVAEDICENLYVDNLVSGADTVNEATLYYNTTKQIFNEAAMNMCKWMSNDPSFMQNIPEKDRLTENQVKVLGMIWKVGPDELSFSRIKSIEQSESISKRSILKVISTVFDPLGLISPVLLKPKLLLQDMWKRKIEWDDEIPDELRKKWSKLREDLELLNSISVKRCINEVHHTDNQTYELITFTDASKEAYAAVVYLKSTNKYSTKVNLVFSKTRISPIKDVLTIPRLELMGVLIGCRASKFVATQLKISNIRQWVFTDAKCVIEWCKTKKPLKRFVNDRVSEIKNSGIPVAYVNSEQNPADIASRGETSKKLISNPFWWHGPEWILDELEKMTSHVYELSEDTHRMVLNEIKGLKILHEIAMVSNRSIESKSPYGINEIKFSSHHKLIRITAWCSRFITNCKKKKINLGYLTPEETSNATDSWTRYIQQKNFHDMKSIRRNLGVVKDEKGILRCCGRFPFAINDPILLPKNSHYTNLVVVRYHRITLHAGVSQTLAKLRGKYWIIQGRSVVRRIIRNCLICIHWEGAPFKTPKLAPLPDYVTSANNPPFTYVGIDYLGPLFIQDEVHERRKNWICLFTCLNVRAIHLELVDNMSTEEFTLCLRRFIARRGAPRLIISDNAGQIKLGDSIIRKIWINVIKKDELQTFVSSEGIKWKYIIEQAPWKGGFYERLVGMTKRALKKSMGRSKMKGNELRTLLTEIEAMINSRPLVYVNDDINSLEAITPAHFLSINYKTGVPDITDENDFRERSSKVLIENWRKGQINMRKFWNIWLSEYLPTLRERHILNLKGVKGEVNRKPEIGEVVIVKEDKMPRGSWKLAKIMNLIKSEVDGIERAATLMTSDGLRLRRPFRLLFPLELKDIDDIENKQVGIKTKQKTHAL